MICKRVTYLNTSSFSKHCLQYAFLFCYFFVEEKTKINQNILNSQTWPFNANPFNAKPIQCNPFNASAIYYSYTIHVLDLLRKSNIFIHWTIGASISVNLLPVITNNIKISNFWYF